MFMNRQSNTLPKLAWPFSREGKGLGKTAGVAACLGLGLSLLTPPSAAQDATQGAQSTLQRTTVEVEGPPWSALVIGNPSSETPGAYGDSFRIATMLEESGLEDVTLQRDLSARGIAEALALLDGRARALLYVASPLVKDAAGTLFLGAGERVSETQNDAPSLTTIIQQLAQAGTRELILLVEDCAGGIGMGDRVSLPTVPAELNLFLAASAGPGRDCAEIGMRLTDALLSSEEGLAVTARLAGQWHIKAGDALSELILAGLDPAPVGQTVLLAPARANAASTGGTTITDGAGTGTTTVAPVVTLITGDTLRAAPVVEPVTRLPSVGANPDALPADTTITAITSIAPNRSGVGETVAFVAPQTTQIAALPTADGLPEPSIIIGIIQGSETNFDTIDDAPIDLASVEITYDNLDARRALRSQDPELFASLVEGGAFDPPSALLARALQTELKRMECYTAAVDGVWGNGSRGSVERYFAQIKGVTAVSLDPTTQLFRQIIRVDEITCPKQVQAAAPKRSSSSSTSTTRRSNTTTKAKPKATPKPAAPKKPAGGLGAAGVGVFR